MSQQAPPASMLEKAILCLHTIGNAPAGALKAHEVTEHSGIPKATVHRLLKSLTEQQMVSFDETGKVYRLGPATINLGLAALNQLNIPRIARPYLERLSRQTLETTTLSMVQGYSRVYLDQIPSPQEIKMTVPLGGSFPLYAGASSKAILSKMSDDAIHAYLDSVELTPLTESTIVDREALFDDIEEIRMLGYAVSRGERQADAASIAAPVHEPGGHVFGSISVSGPVHRFDRYGHVSIGRLVRECAHEIATELGYRPRSE